MVEFRIIKLDAETTELWKNLYNESEEPPVFYHIDFLLNTEDFKMGKIKIAGMFLNNKPLLLLPISAKNNIAENVTFRGWDNLSLIFSKEGREYIDDFWQHLVKHFSVIVLHNFSQFSKPSVPRSTFLVEEIRYTCPYLQLESKEEDILEKVSKSFKKTINRKRNSCLREEVKFQFSLASDLDENTRLEKFSKLMLLHNMRAEESGIQSRFSQANNQQFHKALLSAPNAAKAFFLEAQDQSGEVIGCYYGFAGKKRWVYFNSGINPEFSKLSLGVVLMYELIEKMKSNNVFILDFLRGTESYKFHWTDKSDTNITLYMSENKINHKAKMTRKYFSDQSLRFGRRKALSLTVKKLFT